MAKSFSEMSKDRDSLLVVDALNLAFRWKHSGAAKFVEDYYSTVLSLANSYECNRIIITADQGSSWYRKNIFPEYKGNRKQLRENQTEEEKEAFERFFEEYTKTLDFLDTQGLLVLRYNSTEADDIAAYLCKIIKDKNIWLISSDRDWDLLISKNVSRFSYVTRKEITLANWFDDEKNHPVDIDHYLTLKCLDGDKGDNIPGVDGVGPKRAAGIIDKYGDIFDICASIPLPGTSKYIQNINESKEQLLTNVELMDLKTYCEEALTEEVCEEIKEKVFDYIC